MCGIFGIINQNNASVKQKTLEKAIKLAAHRGPDGTGWIVAGNWGLAHTRLAIIDLSQQGRQPMQYRNHVITYNGEIYNYLELRDILKRQGYHFSTQTDTEVVLAAYDYWGTDCVQHFNGMWAFAIFDPEKKQIFCSRDRFGIKPFYYVLINGQFCFASEIKQFSALPGWRPQLNPVRCYEFLTKGYHDHLDETLFAGVKQLRGGHSLVYDLQSHLYQISIFYAVAEKISPQISLSPEDAFEQFRLLFFDSIRLRLRADVKVGTALSGGLDSSAIVCGVQQMLQRQQIGELQESVSCCFTDRRYDESFYVDEVVQKTGIKAHRIFPDFEKIQSYWDRVTWYQDEPFASASVIAQYQVFEMAKAKGLTVMLDGQGADEILAGYEKFYLPWFRQRLKKQPLVAMVDLLLFFRLHNIGPRQAWRSVADFRSKSHPEQVGWLHPEWQVHPEALFRRTADSTLQNTSLNLLTQMGLQTLLHYEDRNSMASSVESRLPFLDFRLVEFCLALPDQLKINQARRKYILRESMRPYLPDQVYRRYDKMGFATPQEQWMKSHRAFFDGLLRETIDRSNGGINATILAHQDDSLRWRVIAFGKWLKVFEVGME